MFFQFEPPLPGSALPSSERDIRFGGNVDVSSWKSQGKGAISELSWLNCSVPAVHFYSRFISECVLFWSASDTVRLQVILDMSMSFPFLLLQSQLDPAGTSHNRPQSSTAGVSVYFPSQDFCCQMGVVTCLYQAESNALLLALYTMFSGFLTFISSVVRQF